MEKNYGRVKCQEGARLNTLSLFWLPLCWAGAVTQLGGEAPAGRRKSPEILRLEAARGSPGGSMPRTVPCGLCCNSLTERIHIKGDNRVEICHSPILL